MKFIERFYKYVSDKGRCLHLRPISPMDNELDPKILWEEQKNDEQKLVRSLIIRYVDDDLAEVLKGNGEAYMGGSDEHMAPYQYEKLDINIPSDNVDIEQVWKLYDEWLIKWTPAKELRQLVGEPIRDGKSEKGSESM